MSMTNILTARPSTLLITAAVLLAPAAAHAQARMPHTNATSIGAEIGGFLPKADGMTNGLNVAGTFEHYITARDSLRVAVEFAEPKVEVESSDSLRQIRVGADIVHNWEGGTVHPFVGAGLGAYFLQPRDNGRSFGDSATKFGGSLIAGVEFFTSKAFAVKGEARYHVVTKWNGYDPSGLALTIGAKGYF
jgi:hypothetical protein